MLHRLSLDSNKKILLLSALYLLILITFSSYYPGINGIYVLDDFSNLQPMGKYTGLEFWDNFWLFLLEGNSGPTGRPVSLASFYINDSVWPSPPRSFTYTNIMIHLLNGVLLYWVSHKLAEILKLSALQTSIFSIIATAIWVLHPFHTMTVLYIVQRMTELSATFTFAGLLFYLYGREQLNRNLIQASLLLTLGLGISLLLAILSKENGILLVVYILVIEFFLLRPLRAHTTRYLNYYLVPMVFLPFLLIIGYMVDRTWTGGGFINREFTLSERLLTQSRVLFEYLYYIFIPHTGGTTLFHDDFVISKNLITPWTTLPSVFGIISLIVLSFLLRNKLPLIAFAIAWFFGGHLLESSVLPLELYYEHRNYLPMLGIFLATAWYIVKLGESHKKLITSMLAGLLCLYSFMVIQNSFLWSNKAQLFASWYEYHPNSIRTQSVYSVFVKQLNINDFSAKQLKIQNDSPFAHLWKLKQACLEHKATNHTLKNTLEALNQHPVHTANIAILDEFITMWLKGECNNISVNQMIAFLERSTKIDTVKRNAMYQYKTHTWLAKLYKSKHDFSGTMRNLEKAYKKQPNIDLLLVQGKYLASAGLYSEAIKLLDNTDDLKKNMRKELVLRIRQKEINALKNSIVTKIEAARRLKSTSID